ncbi:MAG: RHS repeat protein [Lachnospiraceae bacterium]|nr:RHS repeat protein [Lachnospiraceae bacterium]
MGKISTDILQGTRQRDNSVNSTSIAADTAASNPSQTKSNTDNGNISRLQVIDKVEWQEPENEVPQNQTSSKKTSSYEIKGAGDPVNMATGEYIYEDKDFILPDMGGEYSFTRRYTGSLKKKPDRSIGKAWALSTDTFVTEEENEAIVTMPDGKTAEYIKHNDRYINKKGGTQKHTLKKSESGYIFTDSTEKVKYYYDESGKIKQKTDRNGNTTDYIYNEYGIEKIMLPTGYMLTFTRENMKIASATDSTGRTVRYEYEKGLLTKVTRCDGTEIKYAYDEKENLIAVTDGSGCTYLENWYDDSHRVIRQQIADGGEYTYTYDEKNRTNTITEVKNNSTTTYEYNKSYDITCIKYPDGSEEKRKLDKYGNISEETDRCGAVTTYTYDIKGNLLVKKEPSGLITRYEYGMEGSAKTWDNAGRHTTYKRDENGNITEERKLIGETGEESVTEYEYDGYGRTTQKKENGRTTKYKYSGTFPYPVMVTSPDGTETRQGYDDAGRLSEKTTEDKTEKYRYTEYNKIETYTDGEGGVTEYKYDKSWRLIEIIRPGQEKGEQYGYDCMDRLIAEEDACGRKNIYKRNAYGDITEIRKCGTKEPDATEDCNAIKSNYNVMKSNYNAIKNNCMGESITYEYDNCHRIIKKNVGTYGSETYRYDSCGRIVGKTVSEVGRHEENNRGYEYTRDKSGRVISVKDPYENITDAYTYDLHGNVKKHIHSTAVLKAMAEATGTDS